MSRSPGTVPGPCGPLQRSPRSAAFPPVPPRALRRLFGTFTGTTRQSDFLASYMNDVPLWVLPPARRFLKAAGNTGISWFPCIEFPCMRGVCDPAEPNGIIALSIPSVLPSASPDSVDAPDRVFRGSIPSLHVPLSNASRRTLRYAAHDSGSEWFAIPSPCDSFLHYSTPVLTSAPGESACPTTERRGRTPWIAPGRRTSSQNGVRS